MIDITIEAIAYHRNGVSGNGFHVVTFEHDALPMIGIVFEEPGHCAVFNQRLLGTGIIAFGENPWRGDEFEDALRHAITVYQQRPLP